MVARLFMMVALCYCRAWAFVGLQPSFPARTANRSRSMYGGVRMEAEELEELNPAIKGKRLKVVDEAQGVWKYEFDIEAPGPKTQSLNARILREIKKKSDFPGYRKGEIPSRLMPEANKFVIEEIMNDGLLTAMETYGLVGADGEGSEADINTDIEELLKVFKPGKPLKFSCTFDAKPKPDTDETSAEDATVADSA